MTIPANWAEPVRAALRETFGVEAADQVIPVDGGMSGAPVLRILVGGKSFLMRLDSPIEGFSDPRRWHGCMRIAAEAGVAPRVYYAGDNGVSIIDFIRADDQAAALNADSALSLKDLGGLLRRLHDAPAFPSLVSYMDGVDMMIGHVRSTGLLSEDELALPLARFAMVAQAYRGLEPQLVSSPNDVNPRNLIHDGSRLWLVDWAAAFLADRYVDLAAIGSFIARDEPRQAVFLEAYFGQPPTEAEVARLYLARQTNHVFYAMAMLSTTGGARPAQMRSLDDLHIALRDGEALMDTPVGRAEYALARLAALVEGVDAPRFEEARRLAR